MTDEPHETPPPEVSRSVAATAVEPPVPVVLAFFLALICVNPIAAIVAVGSLSGLQTAFPSIVFGGLLVAEVCCFSVWAVFGPGYWALRWLAVVAVEIVVFAAGVVPFVANSSYPDWTPLLDVPSLAPLVLSAAHLPFWVFRWSTGYRLVPKDGPLDDPAPPRAQFHIRDMLALTTIVAVQVGFARAGELIGHNSGGSTLIALGFMGLYAVLISVLLGLPCLFAGLIAKDRSRGVWLVLLWSQMPTLLILCFGLIAGPGSLSNFRSVLFVTVLATATPTFLLLGGLQVIRGCGYELRRPVPPARNLTNEDRHLER